MTLNPIGIAVPFFFLLIGIEWAVLARQRRAPDFNNAVADISCGLGEQVLGVFARTAVLFPYTWVYNNHSLWMLDSGNIWTWVLAFVLGDALFYAYHRFSHRVNVGWAAHAVHHQSEAFNLSVALRQPWFSQVYAWAFYLPLAILGVSPVVYATSFAINLLYQFWIHTEAVGKLGWYEWIFNTPSHHRVHHGINPQYVDKNYAGIFIVWDRLFGTFEEEQDTPQYGTLKPLRSWNPVWANLVLWWELARQAWEADRWRDKLFVWVAPPGWHHETGTPEPASFFPPKGSGYAADCPRLLHFYIALQMLFQGALLVPLLTYEAIATQLMVSAVVVLVLWVVVIWAGWFESRPWAWPGEWLRLGALAFAAVGLALVYEPLAFLLFVGPAMSIFSAVCLAVIARQISGLQAA